jgi:hypothetical protein
MLQTEDICIAAKSIWDSNWYYNALLPDFWLEVSIRKVLRPANSAQVFVGFSVSISECCDGSQDSKLLLHASHVALPS